MRYQQNKASDNQQEVNVLVRKLADASNEDDTPVQQGRPKKRKVVEHGTEADAGDIRLAGRTFTIMQMLWLRDPSVTFKTVVDEEYNELERFENIGYTIQGQIQDMLEVLPDKFHQETIFQTEWFQQNVSSHSFISLSDD